MFKKSFFVAAILGFAAVVQTVRAQVQNAAADWSLAVPGGSYRFPADHAWHPDYKTEWWYFTGNLQTADGKTYGYELTFFRQGTLPPDRLAALFPAGQPRSRFVQGDFKFAHFAVSDLAGHHFYFTERTTRGAFGEAGFGPAPTGDPAAPRGPLAWLEDWQLVPQEDGTWHLTARSASPTPMAVDFLVRPAKPPVVHGEDGVSQKAAGLGNASHYYSFTRLETTGTLTLGDNAAASVHGDSWFDHEWASNQLAADQVGWDWFCFQFDDGTEMMLYAMRRRDGSVDPVSAGTFVDAAGQSTHLERTDFQLEPARTWKSRQTEATYPIAWKVSVPRLELAFSLEPALDDQELVLPPISYWEGATRVAGQRAGKAIAGKGYMELTGYAGALKGLQKANSPEEDLRRSPR